MATKKKQAPPPEQQKEGEPNPESVVSSQEFVSPKGRKYTILRTNETDETDK